MESSVGKGEADLREGGARVSLRVRNAFHPNQLEACLRIVATRAPGGQAGNRANDSGWRERVRTALLGGPLLY